MKPPAFQFYADDFLGGTITMSHAERGLYIHALCLQWTQGAIEREDLEALAGSVPVARVAAKFSVGVDGKLRNARLESERQKQSDYRQIQAENRRLQAEIAKQASRLQCRVALVPTKTVGQVVGSAAVAFGVDEWDIKSRKRHQPVALARQAAMAYTVRYCEVSASEAGRMFNRDHTTVVFAINSIKAMDETNPNIRAKLAAMRELVETL